MKQKFRGRGTFSKAIIYLFSFVCLLAGSVHARTVHLSWNANTESDLGGYKLNYGLVTRTSSCPDGGYTTTIDVGNTTYYQLSGLLEGLQYFFSVTAYDLSNNVSCYSNEVSSKNYVAANDTIPPSVPSHVTAVLVAVNQISISWNASSDNVGVSGYKIYRKEVLFAATTGTTYTDAGLGAGENAIYTVSAYDAAGNESAQSGPASVSGLGTKEIVYPVPYKEGKNTEITFANLIVPSRIQLFTLDGNMVFERQVQETSYSFVPKEIASGVYIYTIKSSQGISKGKIVIIK